MTHPHERIKAVSTENIKRLSVQISLTGLSVLLEYSDADPWSYEHKLPSGLHPGDILLELQELMSSEPRLEAKAEEVVVIYHHTTFTFVPEVLFEPNNLADYLKYNAKILPRDYLDYDLLKSREMVNVYVPFTNINNYFFDRYGDFTFLHSATVLLAAIARTNNTNKTQLNAHLDAETLLVAITSGRKVALINAFAVNCPEDFAYYLLFCMEQLQLDPKEVTAVLSGTIKEDDPYFELAYRYIKDVEVLSASQQPFLLKNVAGACE